MVLLDPLEEIRQLMEEEDIPREEATARVRADLDKRLAVEVKPWKRSTNNPLYKWNVHSAKRGNRVARGKSGRPRSGSKT